MGRLGFGCGAFDNSGCFVQSEGSGLSFMSVIFWLLIRVYGIRV